MISFKNLQIRPIRAFSPKISFREYPTKRLFLLAEINSGHSIKIWWTEMTSWQVGQRGACLSGPLTIRYLWVKKVWPMRRRVNTILDLLSSQRTFHGRTEGLIDFILKLLSKAVQCSCHLSLMNDLIILRVSKYEILILVVWPSLVAASAAMSALPTLHPAKIYF